MKTIETSLRKLPARQGNMKRVKRILSLMFTRLKELEVMIVEEEPDAEPEQEREAPQPDPVASPTHYTAEDRQKIIDNIDWDDESNDGVEVDIDEILAKAREKEGPELSKDEIAEIKRMARDL